MGTGGDGGRLGGGDGGRLGGGGDREGLEGHPGHCTVAPAAINWVATAAPHAESHGVTAWVVPAPLTVLNTNTDVLYLIHSSPAAGMQAPRALALEVSRL